MKRILAHSVFFEGVEYHLSIVQFSDDLSSVEVVPFVEETADTSFVDGKVVITESGDKFIIEFDGKELKI